MREEIICSENPGNPLEEIGRKAGNEELGKCICNLNNGKLGVIKTFVKLYRTNNLIQGIGKMYLQPK